MERTDQSTASISMRHGGQSHPGNLFSFLGRYILRVGKFGTDHSYNSAASFNSMRTSSKETDLCLRTL